MEIERIMQICASMQDTNCSVGVRLGQDFDPDTDKAARILEAHISKHISEAANTPMQGVSFDCTIDPDDNSYRLANLGMYLPLNLSEARSIRYDIRDGLIERSENLKAPNILDKPHHGGDPFALTELVTTTRKETPYTIRALARLAAIATRQIST